MLIKYTTESFFLFAWKSLVISFAQLGQKIGFGERYQWSGGNESLHTIYTLASRKLKKMSLFSPYSG